MTKSRIYFQIGTNTGDDWFRRKVLQDKPEIVILVEPNQQLLEIIQENYEVISAFSQVHIYINAIHYEDNQTITLFNPGQEENFSNAHFSVVPMNNWNTEAKALQIEANSITFDTICKNHKIDTIDYLQIDTEGFDSEIIKMIDFTKYKIYKLRFESWGFEPELFTVHNAKKACSLGITGVQEAIEKLKKSGYKVSKFLEDDGDDFLAELITPSPEPTSYHCSTQATT
jgi:FkbM family methyltransferase